MKTLLQVYNSIGLTHANGAMTASLDNLNPRFDTMVMANG